MRRINDFKLLGIASVIWGFSSLVVGISKFYLDYKKQLKDKND